MRQLPDPPRLATSGLDWRKESGCVVGSVAACNVKSFGADSCSDGAAKGMSDGTTIVKYSVLGRMRTTIMKLTRSH